MDEFITEVREQLTVFPSVVLTQVPTPLDELITEVREQLTVLPSAEWIPPTHEIQQECCELQVFEAEQFFSYTPYVYIECTYTPLVVCSDRAFTEFVQGEERCLKFISQDLTFLQASSIPSTFNNVFNTDGTSAKIRESTTLLSIQLPNVSLRRTVKAHLLKQLSQCWVSHWQKYVECKLNQNLLLSSY